jgi:hypothetical protein
LNDGIGPAQRRHDQMALRGEQQAERPDADCHVLPFFAPPFHAACLRRFPFAENINRTSIWIDPAKNPNYSTVVLKNILTWGFR